MAQTRLLPVEMETHDQGGSLSPVAFNMGRLWRSGVYHCSCHTVSSFRGAGVYCPAGGPLPSGGAAISVFGRVLGVKEHPH